MACWLLLLPGKLNITECQHSAQFCMPQARRFTHASTTGPRKRCCAPKVTCVVSLPVHCALCVWLQYEAKLQAKDAENQELMTMCDQLLQQQEARRS